MRVRVRGLCCVLMTAVFHTSAVPSEKKEEESEDVAEPVLDDEDPPFQDDPNDFNYQPQNQR